MSAMSTLPNHRILTDKFGRTVQYLRLSVTDRCDFRCTYCMAEEMTFLPKAEILTLEELLKVAKSFISLGTTKIRITGGEPLVRKNIVGLMKELGQISELNELCLTTNGSHLAKYAEDLKAAGVNSINVSIDSLKPERFTQLTRVGKLHRVLEGIDVAIQQGFDRLKINSVILRNFNLDETCELVEFAMSRELDISFIEEMPLGKVDSHARENEYVSSDELRELISREFKLVKTPHNTMGPSNYWSLPGFSTRVGFISPHSHNFCSSCNRVRVTASGRLLLCLGNEHSVDLRRLLRETNADKITSALQEAIVESMNIKPEKHEFDLNAEPQVLRFMNATGG